MILALNAGSSSIKYALGDIKASAASFEEAVAAALKQPQKISAAAHRILHGGTEFTGPVLVTPQVIDRLRSYSPLAPLHQEKNIAGIELCQKLLPNIPQIACFDTMFHMKQTDPLFTDYALPKNLRDKGIRRYGFHGLSYEWIAHVLRDKHPALASGRVIAAHLGNGSSLCAMRNGESVDTTMGLTALDGLVMGTRSGALDPGAMLYLLRDHTPQELEHILYEESGLKGLSGFSGDVRKLLESPDPAARFALDYFCLRVAKFIGMMAASLGGVDTLVFTGGIGENAAPLRDDIVRRLSFLPPFETLVIPTDEERMMIKRAEEVLPR